MSFPPAQDLGVFVFEQTQRLIVDPTVDTLSAMRRFANATDDPPMTALVLAAIVLSEHAKIIESGTPNKPTAVNYCQEKIDGLRAQKEATDE